MGCRSRLSVYSGGTVWDFHPLPFYPNAGHHSRKTYTTGIQYHRDCEIVKEY